MAEESAEQSILAECPEMNPGPVCRLDRCGKVILANAAARRLFGDRELRGKVWQTFHDAKVLAERYRWEYNTVRPHSSLGYRPPAPETSLPLQEARA